MSDLTVKILERIHEDIRGMREDNQSLAGTVKDGFERMDRQFERNDARFEVLETTLRDLAQQLVMLGNGLRVALDRRAENDQLADHESRIAALESRLG